MLSDLVLRTIRRHDLIPDSGRVVVALSGGADSVALLHVLHELQVPGRFVLAGAAHFNHQLRGAEADADEAFCAQLAEGLGIHFEAGRGDVRQAARDMGRSIEDAARLLRYQFLESAADRIHAERIAVAQTRDDQAETFLLRLLRGAGPRGLAGIRPRAGRVVRPFLDVRRQELRDYLASRSVSFREDASNADVTIPRNKVRHELLPYLEREFSPAIAAVLAREAAIAREDEDQLSRDAIDRARSVVLADGGVVDVRALSNLSPSIATRVARLALERRAGQRFLGHDHLQRFLCFARAGQPGSALSLPGQQAVHRGQTIELRAAPARGRSRGRSTSNSFHVSLSIPGDVNVPGSARWAISAELLEATDWNRAYLRSRGPEVVVARPGLPLAVRSRKPGDRFVPLGMPGQGTKLQDFLVNRRVPREERDGLPLVVDRDDRIVWVVGEAVSEDFRVTDPSQGVILLKARRLGGEG